MHCAACELLIEQSLSKVPGVISTKASLADRKVIIKSQKGKSLTLADYNIELKKLGYLLTSQPVGQIVWDQNMFLKAGLVLAILAIITLLAKLKGFHAFTSVSETSSLFAFFIFGLAAGLSSCAALVGGFLLSLSKQWNSAYGGNSLTQRSVPFVMFNVGRLASYALLGGLLGAIGGIIQFSIGFTAFFILIVSIFMVIIGLQMLGVAWANRIRFQLPISVAKSISSTKNFNGKYMPFLAGASTFFLPCGFTLLAQTIALTTGSFITSSIIMFVFALGTLPSLGVISFSSMKFQTHPSFAGAFNLIAGILIVVFGLYNINSQLVVLGMPNLTTLTSRTFNIKGASPAGQTADGLGSEIVTLQGKSHQNVHMKAKELDYYPSSLTLQSGIPTTLYIKNDHVVGCAQAMSLRGLYNDIVLLNQPTAKVTFTPKKGTYYISCSMGMVRPVVVNVI